MNCLTCAGTGSAQTAIALCVHGADVPTDGLIWQDALPEEPDTTWAGPDIAAPKEQIAASEVTLARLISTAWATAGSLGSSDKRRGANGARIRLEPQCSWEVDVHMLAGLP